MKIINNILCFLLAIIFLFLIYTILDKFNVTKSPSLDSAILLVLLFALFFLISMVMILYLTYKIYMHTEILSFLIYALYIVLPPIPKFYFITIPLETILSYIMPTIYYAILLYAIFSFYNIEKAKLTNKNYL